MYYTLEFFVHLLYIYMHNHLITSLMSPNIILLAFPIFFLTIGIELYMGWRKGEKLYRFNDAITNLNIGVGSQVFGIFLKIILFGTYLLVHDNFAIMDIPTTWYTFILLLVAFDFLYYWAHRWSHEWNFLWGAHVVHHQSEEYNLSVALRQSWIHSLLAFFIFLPLPFLGFDPTHFLMVAGIVTLYQYWIHTKAIKKFPAWVEYVFNTPSHHRVHHGRNPKYIDKNHAATFILWDRLFGTFAEEEEEPTYGITNQFKSWNPTWANVDHYAYMWNNMKQMKSWKDKLRMIVARPGWLPDYMGGYQAPPELDKNQKKFDKKSSAILNVYIMMQFVLITWGLVSFLIHFDTMGWGFRITMAGLIILSTMTCGAILESKRWVIFTEYAKLLLAAVSINILYYYLFIDWFYIMLVSSSVLFIVLNFWFTLSWYRDQNMRKLVLAK